LSFNTL
jgi:hypothetical protein